MPCVYQWRAFGVVVQCTHPPAYPPLPLIMPFTPSFMPLFRPFSRKLQLAWERLNSDQSAVTRKLKGMKFNYVSVLVAWGVHS